MKNLTIFHRKFRGFLDNLVAFASLWSRKPILFSNLRAVNAWSGLIYYITQTVYFIKIKNSDRKLTLSTSVESHLLNMTTLLYWGVPASLSKQQKRRILKSCWKHSSQNDSKSVFSQNNWEPSCLCLLKNINHFITEKIQLIITIKDRHFFFFVPSSVYMHLNSENRCSPSYSAQYVKGQFTRRKWNASVAVHPFTWQQRADAPQTANV